MILWLVLLMLITNITMAEDFVSYLNQANTYNDNKQYSEAFKSYHQAYAMAKNRYNTIVALASLVVTAYKTKNTQHAKTYLGTLFAITPNHSWATEYNQEHNIYPFNKQFYESDILYDFNTLIGRYGTIEITKTGSGLQGETLLYKHIDNNNIIMQDDYELYSILKYFVLPEWDVYLIKGNANNNTPNFYRLLSINVRGKIKLSEVFFHENKHIEQAHILEERTGIMIDLGRQPDPKDGVSKHTILIYDGKKLHFKYD